MPPGRRFGKTHLSINEILDKALRCTNKNPQYAYIAPTFGAAKRIAWDLLKDYTKHIPGVTYNEAELRCEIHRGQDKIKILLLGSENPGSIRGIYLDGVVLDEFAECDPTIWSQVVRPALSDRLGWAIFIGTPKGKNAFYDVYTRAQGNSDWFTKIYRADETKIIPISELEASKQTMSEDEYAQEFLCDFAAALVGAYYGKEMAQAHEKGRISIVEADPSVPVGTAWDLGIDDSTAIWFWQLVGREIRIVNYLEFSNLGLSDIVREIVKLDYFLGEHLLPHDAAHRELGTGVTRQETLRKLGLKNTRIVPKLSLEDGINATRLLIKKCWFDKEKCGRGITALENYERKWDEKNKIFMSRPLHNWCSHGSDAFRTLAVGLDENRPSADVVKTFARTVTLDYNPFE